MPNTGRLARCSLGFRTWIIFAIMNGATAIVTGASSNLGAKVASRLIGAGAHVLLVSRSLERLKASSSAHRENPRCVPLAADLTDANGIAALQQEVERRGRLDVLVLGSGIYKRSDDPTVLLEQFRSNVLGPYALLRAVLPFLIAAQGQVVFINSTQGLKASGGVGQYAATHHAMRALADSLRDEVNEAGVRVSTIYLGRTATERQREIHAFEGRPYRPERLIQPDDVATVILGLLSLPRTAEATDITLRPMLKS
jgi:NADP-dependent 3-hydroxy acid dehydrogenase YdfG